MNPQDLAHEQESVFVAMRQQIARTPVPDLGSSPSHTRRPMRRSALAGGLSAAVVSMAVVGILAVTGVFTDAQPAFAITVSRLGVTITLHQFGALKALNATLAAEDLPIRAVPVLRHCTATAQVVGPDRTTIRTIKAGWVSSSVTLHVELAHRPPRGDIFVVAEARSGPALLFPVLVQGRAPTCIAARPTLHSRRSHP